MFRPRSSTPAAQGRFFLRLTNNWLFLTIIPFAVLPDDARAETALMRRLLELNRSMTLAKLAIERREVVLTVELPTQDLTPNQLRNGLAALSFYAVQHHAAIAAVARPRLNRRLRMNGIRGRSLPMDRADLSALCH